jgi:hypothetical protein
VAQLNRTLTQALRTPLPASSDSDDVVLALETARALEGRGDVLEAARWVRRAAEEAESQGNDARVLLFAHVAADLTSSIPPHPSAPVPAPRRGPEPSEPEEPTMRQFDFATTVPRAKSLAHGAPDPSLRTIPDDESSVPTMIPPGPASKTPQPSRSPNPSPALSFLCQLSISPDRPISERTMRVGAIRVAIRRTSPGGKCFSVEQLDAGQELPAGTTEGMLVVARNVDGARELPPMQPGKRPTSAR